MSTVVVVFIMNEHATATINIERLYINDRCRGTRAKEEKEEKKEREKKKEERKKCTRKDLNL